MMNVQGFLKLFWVIKRGKFMTSKFRTLEYLFTTRIPTMIFLTLRLRYIYLSVFRAQAQKNLNWVKNKYVYCSVLEFITTRHRAYIIIDLITLSIVLLDTIQDQGWSVWPAGIIKNIKKISTRCLYRHSGSFFLSLN